jgi:hypothetical protein
MKKEL